MPNPNPTPQRLTLTLTLHHKTRNPKLKPQNA